MKAVYQMAESKTVCAIHIIFQGFGIAFIWVYAVCSQWYLWDTDKKGQSKMSLVSKITISEFDWDTYSFSPFKCAWKEKESPGMSRVGKAGNGSFINSYSRVSQISHQCDRAKDQHLARVLFKKQEWFTDFRGEKKEKNRHLLLLSKAWEFLLSHFYISYTLANI